MSPPPGPLLFEKSPAFALFPEKERENRGVSGPFSKKSENIFENTPFPTVFDKIFPPSVLHWCRGEKHAPATGRSPGAALERKEEPIMSEHEPICPSVPVLATPLTWGWNRLCIFRCRQRLRPLVREGTPRVDTPQYDRVLALTSEITRRSALLWRMRNRQS